MERRWLCLPSQSKTPTMYWIGTTRGVFLAVNLKNNIMKALVNKIQDTKNPDYKMCMFEDVITTSDKGDLIITCFEPTLVSSKTGDAIASTIKAGNNVMISAKEKA